MTSEPEVSTSWGWRRLIADPELVIAAFILMAIVFISCLQVCMRYLFNAPLDWTQEVSGILVVWMTFIASIGLMRHNVHTRVELFEEMIENKRAVQLLAIAIDLLVLLFLISIVYSGWLLMGQVAGQKTAALRLPVGLEVVVVPASAAVMTFMVLVRIIRRVLL
ncbi:TRAP transporter small permease [Pararhizobium mangrovi]|uniref:TRAP transporter small permease protein n=1 Tax=Pararhizobium mangrovi TaxID=2590452 RepID=A0A506U1U5_9HYPH|nr:TRAP transporter small permease subunit [Pararhizobium mangrovi]TPW27426.1 TRAP transporter small permease subunit [Pararhizobium mangrovi]